MKPLSQASASPLEIELKLGLPPEQTALFLKLMARRRCKPEQHKLVTRYFDTPDFALSSQGIALRVRKIGRRWVQTLKTEGARLGGLSQRVEHEMAVPGDKPDWSRFPAEVQAWVPESLRVRLVPVFETHFSRTAWLIGGLHGAQVEVALDVGEVLAGKRSQPICELELELKAGQPDALYALAQTWAGKLDCLPLDVSKAERGVRLALGQPYAPVQFVSPVIHESMCVEDGFVSIVQACLTQFQANLPGVLEAGISGASDPEFLHQARVALRRLRVALRLYRKVCIPADALLADLSALDAALGPARDWDVLCGETLPAIAPAFPETRGWKAGMRVLEAERIAVRSTMQATVRQIRPGVWLLAFQLWLLQAGWRNKGVLSSQLQGQQAPLKEWACKKLKKSHQGVVRGARKQVQGSPSQRHALRLAIKHQRYATEFFGALFDPLMKKRYLRAIRSVQSGLGRLNDMSVGFERVSEFHGEMGTMRPFLLGWLAALQSDTAVGEIENQLQSFIKTPAYW